MKKLFITLSIILVGLTACTSNQGELDAARKSSLAQFVDEPTTIEFEEMSYDFGTITEGEEATKIFKFKNTGDVELVLLNVKPSCGCTAADNWPKAPISPGESGEIEITFNSTGKVGNIRKSVRVEANTMPTMTVLTIVGKVNQK